MAGPQVLYTGFSCEPYTKSGLQRCNKDPRVIQAPQTTVAMQIIKPRLAVWGNVTQFFTDDPVHQVYSTAVIAMSQQMHAYPPIMFYDTDVGGMLCRPRGFALWEALGDYCVLPNWNLGIQRTAGGSPADWAFTAHKVPIDLWVKDIYHRNDSSGHTLPG